MVYKIPVAAGPIDAGESSDDKSVTLNVVCYKGVLANQSIALYSQQAIA